MKKVYHSPVIETENCLKFLQQICQFLVDAWDLLRRIRTDYKIALIAESARINYSQRIFQKSAVRKFPKTVVC